MKEAKKQLAEWDAELNQLHERNGDLGLEVQNLREQLADRDNQIAELRSELIEARGPQHKFYTQIEELQERNRLLHIKTREERQKLEEELKTLKYRDESKSRRLAEKQSQLDELETQLADLKQNSATASKLPEAANLLNRLKANRKKSTASLADVEKILEILGGNNE